MSDEPEVRFTQAETESALMQTADDRSVWRMYTADPVVIRKMEAIDAELLRDYDDHQGKLFLVRADQVIFRRGKRQLSETSKAALVERLHEARAARQYRHESAQISTEAPDAV